MSSAGDPASAASTRPPARLNGVAGPRKQRHAGDRRVHADAEDIAVRPGPGQPGHGQTATLRRQLVWMAEDHKARNTGVFEVICRDCGDHPSLDYSEVPPRLQQIRGPYTLQAGVAAYADHLGVPRLRETRRGWPGADDAVAGPADPDPVTRPRPATRLRAVRASRSPHDSRDPKLYADAEDVAARPGAGQPGHGRTASLRRQPVRIADGRMEGGYTSLFELICPGCGDHPYVDYSEVPPRLQQIRGPYTMSVGLAVYAKHLGAE